MFIFCKNRVDLDSIIYYGTVAATTLNNVFGVNRIFNKVLCAFCIPKHGSGQSPVHYCFFQSTDVIVNTNLFLFGWFQFPGPINVVVSTVPENQKNSLTYYYYCGNSVELEENKKNLFSV